MLLLACKIVKLPPFELGEYIRKDNDKMKVQAVQMQNTPNYNNNLSKQSPNFTGIHAPKNVYKTLDLMYMLEHGYIDCADKFEVLVTKEPLFKGFWGKIVSLFSKDPLYIQAGEGIKKNADGKYELTGVKTTKHLLGEEPKYTSAYSELKTKIMHTLTSAKLKNCILKDIFDVRDFEPQNLKRMLNGKDYQETMQYYANKLLDKDAVGNTLLHNNEKEVVRANTLLSGYPELLAKVHMVENQYGDYPINNIHIMNLMSFDDGIILDTVRKLKDVPNKLLKILNHRGSQGHSIIDILQLNANIENEAKIISTIEDVEGHLNTLQNKK